MKDYTDITLLVDRSGSMRSIKESMETTLENFLKEHRGSPNTKVSLVTFDDRDDQCIEFQDVPIRLVEDIKIHPRGNTPLIDSMCKVIDSTGRRFANMHESDRPARVLFIVITDGEENCSRTYKRQDVFNRVRTQEDHYKWQFMYLGANQDVFKESQAYGFNPNYSFKFSPQQQYVANMAGAMIGSTRSYVNGESESLRSLTKSERLSVASTEDLATETGNNGGTVETT